MIRLDPRLHAYREDLAAASLQDKVRAPRYVTGEVRQVAAPAAPIRVAPRFDAQLATEALSGELLTVYDVRDGWAWVQLHEDGYVGYTTLDCLSSLIEENTHRVSARLTYVYSLPDMKSVPITKLSFSATVAPIGKQEGRFAELSRGGFIFVDHLVGIRERAKDFVRVAERLVGVPYLWGGKTTLGIDCSGLVQLALRTAGVRCLRDSDMQLETAGEPQDPANVEAIQRGDLLFWKGHVAIAQSPDWMIHASAHHMEVVVEQIRRAIERMGESHGALLAVLRPNVEAPGAAREPAAAQPAPRSTSPAPQPASAPPAAAPKPVAAAPQRPAPGSNQPSAAQQGGIEAKPQATAPAADSNPQPEPTAAQTGGVAPERAAASNAPRPTESHPAEPPKPAPAEEKAKPTAAQR